MNPSQPPTAIERPKRLPASWLRELERRTERDRATLGTLPPPRIEVPS